MALTTTSQINHASTEWYNPTLLSRAVPYLVHIRYAQVRDIPRNSGDTIKFRKYGNLTAATTPLVEGVTPTGSQLSITDITATVEQYGDYVTLTDKLQFTTFDPILNETAEILADQAADTIDQLTRDVLVAGTTIQYASTATQASDITNAMVLDADEIREAVLTLQENKAKYINSMISATPNFATQPIAKSFVAFIGPRTLRDLKGDSNFVPVKNYPSQSDVMEGEVGSLDDVRFIMTTNAYSAAEGSASANVYRTVVFGKDFYGVSRISGETLRNIIKPLGSAGTADPLEQRSTSGWKATFVAKILNNNYGVVIYHGATQ